MSDLEVVLPKQIQDSLEKEDERTGRSKSEVTRAALEEYFMRRDLL